MIYQEESARSGPVAGRDPDIGPLGGHQLWRGVKGAAQAPVGPGQSPGRGFRGGGGAPRNKTIFSILNGFGELSFIMSLAYFFIFRVSRNASNPHICM